GASGIAWSDVERDRRVAKRQLLTVLHHHVFLRLQAGRIKAGLLDKIPICFRGHDPCVVAILKKLRRSILHIVSAVDEDVFHIRGIETHLLKSFRDGVSSVLFPRIEQDDSVGCFDRPYVVARTDAVQVVEYLHWFNVPLRPFWYSRGCCRT